MYGNSSEKLKRSANLLNEGLGTYRRVSTYPPAGAGDGSWIPGQARSGQLLSKITDGSRISSEPCHIHLSSQALSVFQVPVDKNLLSAENLICIRLCQTGKDLCELVVKSTDPGCHPVRIPALSLSSCITLGKLLISLCLSSLPH